MQTLPSYSSSTNSEAKQTEAIIMRVLTSYVRIVCDYPGPSASTGEQVPVSDLLWLGLVWSCFVFCLLFLLYSGTPVNLYSGTHRRNRLSFTKDSVDFTLLSLNVRGIRSAVKRKALFLWLNKQKGRHHIPP